MTKPPLIVIRRPINTPPRPERSQVERHSFTPKEKPNPIALAQCWLRGRLDERALGYYLDGQPANLDRVMRETNRAIIAGGGEPVLLKESWKPC